MVSTAWIARFSFTLSGISSKSFTLSFGINTVLIPPRCAASNFLSIHRLVILYRVSWFHQSSRHRHALGYPLSKKLMRYTLRYLHLDHLWCSTIRHVNMNITFFMEFRIDTQFFRARTDTVIAAWIDSFITSPNEPVKVNLPLPTTEAVSMVSKSPPTSVHARPVTSPTRFCVSAFTEFKTFHTKIVMQVIWINGNGFHFWLTNKFFTALRQILEISRSNPRTPASRV